MKILHISDLHYKSNTSEKKKGYLHKIVESMVDEKIDFVLFTGDLVDKKSTPLVEGFNFLNKNLIEPLNTKLYMCCGNHDIDRSKISDMFKDYVLKLGSEEDVSNFIINNKNDEFKNNIKHIEEYNQLVLNHFSNLKQISDLAFIHTDIYDGKTISITSLNLSWLAFDDNNDYGKLLFSYEIVKKLEKEVKDSDFKIILTHQPLDFLHHFCKNNISKSVFNTFDCIFNGHTHQNNIFSYISSNSGILTCISPAIIDGNNPDYPFGFTFLNIDITNYAVQSSKYEYVKSEDKMILCNTVPLKIPVDENKREKIKISSYILNKCDLVINEANKKFVSSDNNNTNFLTLFTPPVLKHNSSNTDFKFREDKIIKSGEISYKTLLCDNNTVVFGKDKCGKTVLLYKIMIEYLQNYSTHSVIPVYIDLKDYYYDDTIPDIELLIRSFYNFSIKDFEFVLQNYKVKLFIDNVDFSKNLINDVILDYLSNNDNTTCLITSEDIVIDGFTVPKEFENRIYFHDLTKSKIREITYKWPITKTYDKDDIVEKITTIFKQLNIHFNFWTVSLFLWIFEKTNNLDLHNNVELINLYIENLLEKSNLVLSLRNQTFSFENYKDFLSEVAYSLYSLHSNNCYCAKYSDIVNCFEKFKEKNIRIIAESRNVIDYILNKGILIEKSNGYYTFRLNGVFEYFLSHYMMKNDHFLTEVITNSSKFLSFKNELEIYAGFKRNDEDLLIQIYLNCIEAQKKLVEKFKTIENLDSEFTTDNKLIEKLNDVITKLKQDIKPLSLEEQDEIEDSINTTYIESSVRLKKEYNISQINSEMYLNHILILAGVFRNSDDIRDQRLLNEIFDFIINQACVSIIFLIKDIIIHLKKIETDVDDFIELIKSFSPLVVHSILFEAIAHPTLKNIILERINELKKNSANNQFILFILYFLIIDVEPEKHTDLIEDIISISNMFNIQYVIYIKILMYVSFKCTNNPQFEERLRFLMEQVYKKLYPEHKKEVKGIVNQIVKDSKILGISSDN